MSHELIAQWCRQAGVDEASLSGPALSVLREAAASGFRISDDEAESMWRLLSHDAHGLGDDGLRVKDVMRRLGQWIDKRAGEKDADTVTDAKA